jgi:hypothetical protein
MHFSACPTRKPLAVTTYEGQQLHGLKAVVCNEQVFQTPTATFVLYGNASQTPRYPLTVSSSHSSNFTPSKASSRHGSLSL